MQAQKNAAMAGTNTPATEVEDTTTGTGTTTAKFTTSAVRILKIALLCIVAVAPVACILASPQATNCAAGCQDV